MCACFDMLLVTEQLTLVRIYNIYKDIFNYWLRLTIICGLRYFQNLDADSHQAKNKIFICIWFYNYLNTTIYVCMDKLRISWTYKDLAFYFTEIYITSLEPITDENVLFGIVQNILRWCGGFLFIASRANLETPPKNFLIYLKLEPSSSNIDEKTTKKKFDKICGSSTVAAKMKAVGSQRIKCF